MIEASNEFYLVLDANAWVSERMLHSSAGEAVLYAVTVNGASIILPEIVEIEVERVLRKHAAKAVAELQRSTELLRQLSGHRGLLHPVPTEKAIHDGIRKRWKDLEGSIVPAPFTFEQARSALQRVLDHRRPSSDNNEQFRDCCIWASAVEFAATRVVHLVSNDSAFYEARDRTRIAAELHTEVSSLSRDVRLYRTVQEFLAAVSRPVISKLEQDFINDAIVAVVTDRAREIATEIASRRSSRIELGDAQNLTIKGYATPKPSVVAITFAVTFDLAMFKQEGSEERDVETILELDGSCSYSPSLHQTSDLVVTTWTHSLKGRRSGWSTQSGLDPDFINQLKQTHYL